MAFEFEFKNYKVFKDLQKFKLKNVNIIIGKNNSGKSAILKLPKLFSDVNIHLDKPLILSSDNFSFAGDYKDFIYGKANRSFDLNVKCDKIQDELSLSIIVENHEGISSPILEKWSFRDVNLTLEDSPNIYSYKDNLVISNFRGYDFVEFEPVNNLDNESINELKDLFNYNPSDLFAYKTTYIGPIRDKVERFFEINESKNFNSYSVFPDYLEILINDFKGVERKIFTKVSDWYKINFDGWELGVDLDKEPIYSLYLKKDGVKINIIDTGIGINQVLPILIKSAMIDDLVEIISIEEPEAHLNPAVHGNLLEEIVKSSLLNKNKYYIIETHSENFVLRLRRLIAEGQISPDFCSIYNVDFDPTSTSSSIKEIEVLDTGEVNFWPSDIFNDTFNEVIAIRSAQK